MTIGEKIQRLRKARGLSQEALARMMYVTRQTISKWELGQSAPDLALIARLSDIFQVSADYLIKDDAGTDTVPPASKPSRSSPARLRRLLWAGLSGALLAACCVCLICDYFLSSRIGWSLIVIASSMAGWLLLLPAFTAKEKRVLRTLQMASAVSLPLLGTLALLLSEPVVFTFGAGAALLSMAACWGVYAVFRRRRGPWRAGGFALLLMIPYPICLVRLAARFFPAVRPDPASDLFHGGITLALALACFGLDSLRSRRKDER